MRNIPLILLASIIASIEGGLADARCSHSVGESGRLVLMNENVLDPHTHLVWMRCSLGTHWMPRSGCVGEVQTKSLQDAKRIADGIGGDWRVPTADELFSLVNQSCGSPAIDTTAFPDMRPDPEGLPYWTTTPLGLAGLTVYIDFSEGIYDGHSSGFPLPVRLVRSAR